MNSQFKKKFLESSIVIGFKIVNARSIEKRSNKIKIMDIVSIMKNFGLSVLGVDSINASLKNMNVKSLIKKVCNIDVSRFDDVFKKVSAYYDKIKKPSFEEVFLVNRSKLNKIIKHVNNTYLNIVSMK